ncbi:hypothetical protein [Streptomyces jumonjinensis]|uniref:hypothetical protein n=1 Tax=Streptomyces jumonjinensis TaxID=1945 RepID=UPI0037B4142A
MVQRGAKGLFAVDHHHGLRANEARVLDLTDGHLADLGLIRRQSCARCSAAPCSAWTSRGG